MSRNIICQRFSLLLPFLFGVALAGSGLAVQQDPWLRPAVAPAPPENPLTEARVLLGQMLFFDPRLSRKSTMSCATCHNPALGWSDGLPTAVGFDMHTLARATPTILNTSFNTIQMWDGRKGTLEDQATGPIEAAGEMNLPLTELIVRLKAIRGYAPMFEEAYPGMGVTAVTVARALASFERTVLSTESPFDRWREGDAAAVTPAVKRGFELFTDKAKCSVCHMGYNFTDNGFHNIGLKTTEASYDMGRYSQRALKSMRGAFKTPTLRDISLTAPYMRNGAYGTLAEVVEHYDRGGDDKENLDINMAPLALTSGEKADLVVFLESLTGVPADIRIPSLPR